MSNEQALAAAMAVVNAWDGALGEKLQGVYLSGSAATGRFDPDLSDVNLIAVVDPSVSLSDMRPAFQPVWAEHQAILKRAPWVVTPAGLARLTALQPNKAYHLHTTGQVLHGPPLALGQPPYQAFAVYMILADEALRLSSLVAPLHLDVKTRSRRQTQLRRRTRQLAMAGQLDSAAFTPEADDAAHLALLYTELARLAPPATSEFELPADPPNLMPGLLAIYEFLDQLLFVWPNLDGPELAALDWPEIAERVAEDYSGVLVASLPQLESVVGLTQPVSLALEQYQLVWGEDVLAGRTVGDQEICHQLALQAALYQGDAFPHAYLTAADDEMGALIHDLQNQLLNLRLRHELMRRMRNWEATAPLDPLPGREHPPAARMDAIVARAGWWADHYAARLGIQARPE